MPVEVFNKFSTVRPIFQSLEKPVDKTNNNRQEWLLKLRYGQFHKDYPTIENPVDSKIFQLNIFFRKWIMCFSWIRLPLEVYGTY